LHLLKSFIQVFLAWIGRTIRNVASLLLSLEVEVHELSHSIRAKASETQLLSVAMNESFDFAFQICNPLHGK
jgi:hypothetical protein